MPLPPESQDCSHVHPQVVHSNPGCPIQGFMHVGQESQPPVSIMVDLAGCFSGLSLFSVQSKYTSVHINPGSPTTHSPWIGLLEH